MPTFAELLRKYIERTGITDAELARSIGVRRQTIFRWKEGIVVRPRHRDDVLSLAKRLRLTDEERDELLIVAGFAPESMPETYPDATEKSAPTNAPVDAPTVDAPTVDAGADSVDDMLVDEDSSEKLLPAASNAESVTVRLDDKNRLNDVVVAEGSQAATARPAWLKFLPIAALLLLVGAVGFWGSGFLDPSEEPEISTTATPTSIATPTSLPTRTSFPMPEPAAEGETLLLAALFQNFTRDRGYNVAGRLEAALAEQIDFAGLKSDARTDILPIEISSAAQAEQALAESRAALLIWGEYDDGRVLVNLTTRVKNDSKETQLKSPEELLPAINADIPQEVRILALLALGEHFLAQNESTKALTALKKVLTLEPPHEVQKNLYFQLGRTYIAAVPPQYDKAIDAYDKVLSLSPNIYNAYYNRGLVYYNRYVNDSAEPADLAQAIADYSRMIQHRPTYINAYQNRGIAYYQRKGEGDLEAALADLDVVVENQPDSYRSFYNRGLLDISLNRSDQWESDLLQAKELAEPKSDDYVNTLVALCWGYMLEKQLDNALSNCQLALEIAPDRGDSRDSLGIVYALNGDFDAAIQELERHLEWLRSKSAAYYAQNRGPMVEEWIEQLEAGQQPITDEVLEGLRG